MYRTHQRQFMNKNRPKCKLIHVSNEFIILTLGNLEIFGEKFLEYHQRAFIKGDLYIASNLLQALQPSSISSNYQLFRLLQYQANTSCLHFFNTSQRLVVQSSTISCKYQLFSRLEHQASTRCLHFFNISQTQFVQSFSISSKYQLFIFLKYQVTISLLHV